MTRIKFKHWKTGKELVEVGELPTQLNSPSSDRYVLQTPHGDFVDIIKNTVIVMEDVANDKLQI